MYISDVCNLGKNGIIDVAIGAKVTAIHIFKENITLICSKSEADDKTKITAYKDACICAQPNNSKTVNT